MRREEGTIENVTAPSRLHMEVPGTRNSDMHMSMRSRQSPVCNSLRELQCSTCVPGRCRDGSLSPQANRQPCNVLWLIQRSHTGFWPKTGLLNT